jgi:hypothetical protein
MNQGTTTKALSRALPVVLQVALLASPLALVPLVPTGLLPRGFAFLLVNGYWLILTGLAATAIGVGGRFSARHRDCGIRHPVGSRPDHDAPSP